MEEWRGKGGTRGSLARQKGGKGRVGDLRSALEPMRVRIRENMLVLWSTVASERVTTGHDMVKVKICFLLSPLSALIIIFYFSFYLLSYFDSHFTNNCVYVFLSHLV